MDIDIVAELSAARVLAVIRGTDARAAVAAGTTLLDEGIRVVEVALTTPGALSAIEAIREAAPPGSLVGAGTVLTGDDVANVVAAGAQFAVTPAVVDSVPAAVRRGLPVLAGALTPTEAYTARQLGAAAVKLFPASLGGPRYLKALRDPLPDIPFVAVGGVGLADVPAYLAAGAIAVGVGGPLVGDAASRPVGSAGAAARRADSGDAASRPVDGELSDLRERARAYLAAVAETVGR